MVFYGDEEEVWKCPQHPLKHQRRTASTLSVPIVLTCTPVIAPLLPHDLLLLFILLSLPWYRSNRACFQPHRHRAFILVLSICCDSILPFLIRRSQQQAFGTEKSKQLFDLVCVHDAQEQERR
ncbi:hypothetical protein ACSBR2_034234 [Camellia fascicularis]